MAGLTSITLNAGSGGAVFGVDNDATNDYQIVKIGFSTSGTTPVQVSSSNPLPVTATNGITAGSAGSPPSGSNVMTVQSAALTPYKLISAATTNATSVTAAAGLVLMHQAVNNNSSSWRYLKIYDKATAPTVGTDVPVLTLGLPPNGGSVGPLPFKVANGLALAITGGIADTDTTAVAANEVAANFTHS